jgi:hypothetical protein
MTVIYGRRRKIARIPAGDRLRRDVARAAIAWSGGQGRLVTFDGAAGLPSGVLVRADGTVVAGVAAVAAQDAGWVLAAPSRRLADGPVTVADSVAVEAVEVPARSTSSAAQFDPESSFTSWTNSSAGPSCRTASC